MGPGDAKMKQEVIKTVASITCDEYMQKYMQDKNEAQSGSFVSELYGEPHNFLCPDID